MYDLFSTDFLLAIVLIVVIIVIIVTLGST